MSVLLSFLLGTLGCIPGSISVEGGGGGGPDAGQPDAGVNPAEALIQEWSGCMTLDNFRLAQMSTAWGSLAARNGQACSSCHNAGFEGFYADRDDVGMFHAISTIEPFMIPYFSPDVANHRMIVNEAVFQVVGTGRPPHQGHPPFDPTNNAGMTALRSFYDVTLPLQQAHTCDPPRIVP